MTTLLQMDFPMDDPFGDALTEAMKSLAESIAAEPGLIWKIWTENASTKEAGGIYLFENQDLAEKYLKMHSARLAAFGITQINAKFFSVNKALSAIDKATWL